MPILGVKGFLKASEALKSASYVGLSKKGSQIFKYGERSYIIAENGKPTKMIDFPKYVKPTSSKHNSTVSSVFDFVNNEQKNYYSINGVVNKDIYLKGVNVSFSPKNKYIAMTNGKDAAEYYVGKGNSSSVDKFIANEAPETGSKLVEILQNFKNIIKMQNV